MCIQLAIHSSIVGLLAALVWCAPAGAAAIPESLGWDAADPGANPANSWQASVGSHAWAVDGATPTATTSGLPGITNAYRFDGVADVATGHPLQFSGDTDANASFESWFRPTSYSGGQQVVFESGGRRGGLSITLDDSTLLFRLQDYGNAVVSLVFDLSSDLFLVDPTEFVQVVGTVDLDDTAALFVNGSLVASASAFGLSDFAGPGRAGVGNVNGLVGGTAGPGEGDLSGYGAFDGEIALLRYYENQVLTPTEVQQNYDSVALAPEPSTGLLLGMGLMLIAWQRRR